MPVALATFVKCAEPELSEPDLKVMSEKPLNGSLEELALGLESDDVTAENQASEYKQRSEELYQLLAAQRSP